MAFQFPDPSVTPEFTGANGITYSWDATDGKWVVKVLLLRVSSATARHQKHSLRPVNNSNWVWSKSKKKSNPSPQPWNVAYGCTSNNQTLYALRILVPETDKDGTPSAIRC